MRDQGHLKWYTRIMGNTFLLSDQIRESGFSKTENLLINTDSHVQNSRTLKIW